MDIFKKKNCAIIGLILVGFMVIGSFCDFQLSSAIFNPESKFGIFFASYGQLPAMLCVAAGGTLLFKMIDTSKKIKLVLCAVFGVLLNALAIMGIAMDPMLYIEGMPKALSIVIALVLVAACDFGIVKLTKDTSREKIGKFAGLLIATMFAEMIIINFIKVPWGRPRMRMIAVQPDAAFQPWWVIGSEMKDKLMAIGVAGEEFKSFPSGHTGNAACAMLLGALPFVSEKLKGKENLLFFIGVAFTFIVAFSRIIMGAHFLTDVTVGMTVSFVVEYILVRLLLKEKN